jgi:regulator of replication initiation timing
MANPAAASEPSFDSSKLYVWVKGLEMKVNNLLRELDLLKNDLIKKNNDLRKEVKTLNDELLEQKREQAKTLEKMDLIIKELKQTAGKEELMVIKKYLEYWNPINFVTQRDVERVIETKLTLLKDALIKDKEYKKGD